jgi:hypothetical protein
MSAEHELGPALLSLGLACCALYIVLRFPRQHIEAFYDKTRAGLWLSNALGAISDACRKRVAIKSARPTDLNTEHSAVDRMDSIR